MQKKRGRHDTDLVRLERTLDIEFKDKSLLLQALTHPSFLNEDADARILGHNERLEFLGDAVLEIIVTDHLFRAYPDAREGELTRWRSALVNADTCAEISRTFGFEGFLRLGRGEQAQAGTKARKYILANAFEAMLGAIYLDRGIGECRYFVDRALLSRMGAIIEGDADPKGVLQERVQAEFQVTPSYETVSTSGPDHDRTYVIEARLGSRTIGSGTGASKKEAQVAAARNALHALSTREAHASESAATDPAARASGKDDRS